MVVRHVRAVLGAAAAAALVIGLGVAPVAAATPGGAGGGGPAAGTVFPGVLFGVSALSAADAWAAGSYHNNTTGADNTLILRWNGTAWSQVPSPNPGRREALYAVSAASAADAWAAGDIGNTQCFSAVTMILHWNGAAWSQVTSPNPGAACNFLNGVSALSATSAWAAGSYCKFAVNTCHPLILHWNGTSWSQVPTPTPGTGLFDDLEGVAADSPADAWAVGTYCTVPNACSPSHSLILHWNGTRWSQVKSPNPGSGTLTLRGISADSPTDAWAAGSYCTTSSCAVIRTLILHWNGTAWSVVASPSPGPVHNLLGGITALSPADAWATGNYCPGTFSCNGANLRTLILHWNGTRWSTVTSPNPSPPDGLNAVTATAPGNAWAAGGGTVASPDVVILHWNGTSWSST